MSKYNFVSGMKNAFKTMLGVYRKLDTKDLMLVLFALLFFLIYSIKSDIGYIPTEQADLSSIESDISSIQDDVSRLNR